MVEIEFAPHSLAGLAIVDPPARAQRGDDLEATSPFAAAPLDDYVAAAIVVDGDPHRRSGPRSVTELTWVLRDGPRS